MIVTPLSPTIPSLPKDETRAAEYSKAATRGNWGEVWDSAVCPSADEADRRKKANDTVANDAGASLIVEASEKAEGDMFTRAGVAAE